MASVLPLLAGCGSDADAVAVETIDGAKICARAMGAEVPVALDQIDSEQFQCTTPIFAVRDLKASLAYYEDRFGFRTDWTWGEPPDFAGVSREKVQILFCERCQGTPPAWVMVWVADADAVAQDLRRRGAFVEGPVDQPWGLREARVSDPDGNTLRIASPISAPGRPRWT